MNNKVKTCKVCEPKHQTAFVQATTCNCEVTNKIIESINQGE